MSQFFQLFLPTTAFLLTVVSLGVLYWVIKRCSENIFLSTYYFLGLALGSMMFISFSRILKQLFGNQLFDLVLIQDLLIAYMALFLFGALWQSYETEICVPPSFIDDNRNQ